MAVGDRDVDVGSARDGVEAELDESIERQGPGRYSTLPAVDDDRHLMGMPMHLVSRPDASSLKGDIEVEDLVALLDQEHIVVLAGGKNDDLSHEDRRLDLDLLDLVGSVVMNLNLHLNSQSSAERSRWATLMVQQLAAGNLGYQIGKRMPAISSSVGRRLREARERLGWTQAELAQRLGRTPTAISYWEGGQRSPGLDDLIDLAEALQVSPADLLQRSPRVVARSQAALLNIQDLAEAVDRALEHPRSLFDLPEVPRAPTSNPAEAAGFARRLAGQPAPPVDVLAVLHACGCEYIEMTLPEGLQGFVVSSDATPVVVVNQQDSLGRRRFTAAHELGHVLLAHHDTFHVDLNSGEGSPPGYNWRHERAANDFAASLLMPEEFVRSAVENAVVPTVPELAGQFEVSSQAMSIRLAVLSIQLG